MLILVRVFCIFMMGRQRVKVHNYAKIPHSSVILSIKLHIVLIVDIDDKSI